MPREEVTSRAIHDALYTLIEDAQRYQAFAQRANEALSHPGFVSRVEETGGVLAGVGQENRHRAEEAKRLLAQRVAE